MVRATLRIRSWARALKPMRRTAISSVRSPASSRPQRDGGAGVRGCGHYRIRGAAGWHERPPPRAHVGGRRAMILAAQFLVCHCWNFYVKIDAVEQRSAHFAQVALNDRASAAAFARRIREIAARARIHGGDQNEVGRERKRHVGAGEGDRRFFERLAQHLENVARKFRQFIQKQHAVVRQAYFAGTRRSRTTSDQSRVRYGVMRRAKWPLGQQSDAARKQSRDAMDLGGLDGFLKGQWRQDSRESFREHRFTGAWRADHQNVVAARRRHFERALGGGLAAHIAKVRRGRVGWRRSWCETAGN